MAKKIPKATEVAVNYFVSKLQEKGFNVFLKAKKRYYIVTVTQQEELVYETTTKETASSTIGLFYLANTLRKINKFFNETGTN